MYSLDSFYQFIFADRSAEPLHFHIAARTKLPDRRVRDILKQQDLDLGFWV
jgi:hypothetical protein